MSMRLARYDDLKPTKAQREAFDSGEPTLNRWLAQQARQSMDSRDAVTYLLLDEGDTGPEGADRGDDGDARIAGYFALAAGQVLREAAPLDVAKRAPEPIPAVRMGRFAIDGTYQGQGLGAELLGEALLAAVAAGELLGARVMPVDAISEAAVDFYLRYGFLRSPIHPMQLVYDLRVVAASAGHQP